MTLRYKNDFIVFKIDIYISSILSDKNRKDYKYSLFSLGEYIFIVSKYIFTVADYIFAKAE